MKKIIILLMVAFMMACHPYKAATPDASFIVKQEGTVVEDTVLYSGVYFDLIHTGKADKVVYYLGTPAEKYTKPTAKGRAADLYGRLTNNKILQYNYRDTIYCIATCIGEFGEDIKQDIKWKYFYVIRK